MTFNNIEGITKKLKISFSSEYLKYSNEILSIFNNDFTSNLNLNNSKILNVLGLYHQYITKDYSEMENYYLMAINLGDSDAMCELGLYHKNITKDYSQMKKILFDGICIIPIKTNIVIIIHSYYTCN